MNLSGKIGKIVRYGISRMLWILTKAFEALSLKSLLACGCGFCLMLPFMEEILSKAFLYKLLSQETGGGLSFSNLSGCFWVTLFIVFLMSLRLLIFEKKLKLPDASLSA